jgi:hypothetical protein
MYAGSWIERGDYAALVVKAQFEAANDVAFHGIVTLSALCYASFLPRSLLRRTPDEPNPWSLETERPDQGIVIPYACPANRRTDLAQAFGVNPRDVVRRLPRRPKPVDSLLSTIHAIRLAPDLGTAACFLSDLLGQMGVRA